MKHLLHQRRGNYMRSFFVKKAAIFLISTYTKQHDMRKQKNYLRPINFFFFRPKLIELVAIVIRILQLCRITGYTQVLCELVPPYSL